MPTVPTDDQGEEPLVPVYPYNEPGADIQLYAGPLVEADDQQWRGRILLTCGSRLAVVWRLDEIPSDRWAWNALRETDVHLQIRQGPDRHEVAGLRRTLTEGTLHAQSIGSDETALRRVLYHWMNLLPVHSPGLLRRRGRDGRSTWTGRSRLELGPWQLTLDRRSDHPRIWETLASEHNFAMTHVMQVSRADGADFTVEELEPLQLALHFGMSFAFGRWVAPAAPVGFDSAGAMVWRHWASVFCEPGRDGGLAWLHYPDSHDLGDFLSRTYDAFADPDRSHTLKLLLSMAVEVNRAGRVEQRTMTAFSALELLTWVVLKLTGGMSKNQYGALRAHGRIRTMLEAASIDTRIDERRQPAIAAFARAERRTGAPLDGPSAISTIRNRLVHPNAPQDEVYHLDGLVRDTWLLTRHYLNLLILHWLGYTGSYQAVLGPGGWAGDGQPVPWAPPPAAPAEAASAQKR